MCCLAGSAEAAWRGPLMPYLPAMGAASDVPVNEPAPGAAEHPEVELPGSPRFFRQGGRLLWHLASTPARMDARDWRRAGLGVLAIAATVAVLDEPIRDAVDPTPGGHSLLHRADRLGERSTTHLLAAGFYGWGWWQEDERAKAVGVDAFVSAVIAGGLVTSKLKKAFGRARPFLDGDSGDFNAFGGDAQSRRAFPSGHSTEAFAVASVIASHYEDRPAVVWSAYGLAALTGLSRMRKDQHWASDVLAGSLIGYGIGKAVVRFNTAQREQAVALRWQGDAPALVVEARW
ncbi:phosphatase PAP2 family protein [Pseudomarimonas salicorniae]|nr:phosphatase PAP2 family protein [Lysobacter sp. CAU 1642]